jgi:mono/diheme cytochrome c family protein
MMPTWTRAAGIAALMVLLTVGSARAATPAEHPLTFGHPGKPPSALTRSALRASGLVPGRLAVFDPYEHRVIEFEGFDARAVLDHVYGAAWQQSEEFLLTCSDGYEPSIPARRFLDHRALLAYARTDQPEDFTLLKGDVQPAKRVSLGPWYLVWENQRDATVRAEGDFGWPYQLVSFEPVRFVDRFPPLAPPAGASASARRGFAAWRVHCQKCHMLNGDGGELGPELNRPMNVTEYWQPHMLARWILDPASIRVPAKMPPINPALPNREAVVDDLIAYLAAMKAQKRP